MNTYYVIMAVPAHPTHKVRATVEAVNEDIAVDKAFDVAFYVYPQYGALTVESIDLVDPPADDDWEDAE